MSGPRRIVVAVRLIAVMLVVALLCGLAAQAAWAAPGSPRLAGAQHGSKGHGKKKQPEKKKKKKKKKKKRKKKQHKVSPSKPTTSTRPPPAATPTAPTPAPAATTPATPATPSVAAPIVTPALVTHLLAQQGLLVGMASNVLQTQLYLDFDSESDLGECDAIDGGGADEVTSATVESSVETDLTLVLYYQSDCTEPYITSTATVVTTATGSQIDASSVYTDTNGTTLGTLTTQAAAIDGANDVQLAGLGTFTAAAAGSLPVSLGLTCDVEDTGSDTVPPFPCVGGVAQEFPGLGRELGSLTPLTLSVSTNGIGSALTFASTAASTLEIAPLDSLSLSLSPTSALMLSGTPLATLTDSISGQAADFALFPPTPTSWASSDTTDAQAFQIAVADDATRSLNGSVTGPGGAAASYATFSLDQSGTGTISYGGAAAIPVTSWILSG